MLPFSAIASARLEFRPQLADVARPGVARQRLDGPLGQLDRVAVLAPQVVEEVPHEFGHVLEVVAQGRHVDGAP